MKWLILIFEHIIEPVYLSYMKSVINLVRTSQGYSVFEGNQEINKPTSKIKEKSYSASKSTHIFIKNSRNITLLSIPTYPTKIWIIKDT